MTRSTDTPFPGIPREAWGVSNDVRPTLRPPRFDEAVFEIREGETLRRDMGMAR